MHAWHIVTELVNYIVVSEKPLFPSVTMAPVLQSQALRNFIYTTSIKLATSNDMVHISYAHNTRSYIRAAMKSLATSYREAT